MAEYSYHPSSTLRLGAGFDPRDPTRVYPRFMTYSEKRVESGILNATLEVREIKSRKELFDRMNVSASISGHSLFYSASAGVTFDHDYSFTSDSFTWAISAYVDFGRLEAVDPVIPSSANAILTGDPKDASEHYGIEVALLERRAVLAIAVFSLKSLSRLERTQVQSYLKGGVSIGAFGAELAATYNRFITEAQKVSSISLSIRVIGGKGIEALAPAITDYTDINTISKILSTYVGGYTFESAAPVSYSTASLKSFGWKGLVPDLSLSERRIAELFLLYRDVESITDRLREITSITQANPYYILIDNSRRLEYLELYKKYEHLLDTIVDAGRKALLDPASAPTAADLIPTDQIQLPELPDPPIVADLKVTIDKKTFGLPNQPPWIVQEFATATGYVKFDWRFALSSEFYLQLNAGPTHTQKFVAFDSKSGLSSIPFAFTYLVRQHAFGPGFGDIDWGYVTLQIEDRFGRSFSSDIYDNPK